jgi:hypothetical protein
MSCSFDLVVFFTEISPLLFSIVALCDKLPDGSLQERNRMSAGSHPPPEEYTILLNMTIMLVFKKAFSFYFKHIFAGTVLAIRESSEI